MLHHNARGLRTGPSVLPLAEVLEPRLMLSTAPTLTIDGPADYVNYKQGDVVTITYTAVDPDSPATVDFFINTDYAVNDNAIRIATGISKDAPGQVTVDTSGLKPGLYYVYGCITDSDGTSAPVYTGWPSTMVLAPADNAPTSHVMLNTSMGSILLDLDRQDTPISVANFLTYVNAGFFDNLIFHRVSTTNHVIQSGGFDDQTNQMPTNVPIPNENSTLGADSLHNLRGTIGMARTDDVNSATSQFYINTADNPSFDYVSADDPGYCVFGHVVSGMDVVDAISAVPTGASGDLPSEVPVTPIYIQSVIADRADMQVFSGDTQLLSDSLSALAWSGAGNDMTFTITNDGALPMALGNVVLAYNSGFVVTKQPDASVAPGASTTFTISQAPGEYATRSADVSFTSDAADGGAFSFSLGRVPSFQAGSDVSVAKGSGQQLLDYWASNIRWGTDDSNSTLAFETSNDNEAMFAEQPEVTPDGTLEFTPADGATGTAQVTAILDEVGDDWVIHSQPRTFTITITATAINAAPTFTAGDDQTVEQDAGPQSVPNWATDISAGSPSESGQVLSFEVANGNNDLFSQQPAVSADGTLTYTPAAGASGVANVTVTLKDDGGTANGGVDTSDPQTFTITITAGAVNAAPTFTAGDGQTANEGDGPQSVPGWATEISAGSPEESGQALSFEVTNDNNDLFSEQPAVSADGTLTYTPAPGASGVANVTVTLKDDGGTANGGVDTSDPQTFTITITSGAVNAAPTFTPGDDQTVEQDSGTQSVPGWATDISAGSPDESGQVLSFEVTNNNNGLFSEQPTVSADGTLTYTPAPGARGVANVTVTLKDDGGTDNGGVDTSDPQTFTITINSADGSPTADSQDVAMTDSGVVDGILTGHDAQTPDQLTYVLVTGPQHGTVTITDDGFHYDIDASYNGSDSFTFAVVDAGDGVNPGLTSDPATVTITGGRSVSFDAKGHAAFVDSAGKTGTATLKRGTGSLFINADGTIGRVFLSGTTDKSTLTIATAKKARVAVLGIDAQGPLVSITGKYADLQGDVKLGAATGIKTSAKLTFGTIGDACIDSAMPIRSIAAASWVDSDEDLDLFAPSVGSVSIKGDLQIDAWVLGAVSKIKAANLTHSGLDIGGTLGSLAVAGWVDSSTVCAGGNVSSVKIGGSSSSDFGSGVSYSLLRDQHHVQPGDVDNVPTGTIKTFIVKGIKGPVTDFFVESTISAAMGTVTVTNWDGVDGLYAPGGKVKKVTLKNTFKPAHVFGQFTHPV